MQEQQDILLYRTEDGRAKIQVRLTDNTVWLTQAAMVELFQSSKANISEHIKHIFEEGELQEDAVVRNFRTTAADGKIIAPFGTQNDLAHAAVLQPEGRIIVAGWAKIGATPVLIGLIFNDMYVKTSPASITFVNRPAQQSKSGLLNKVGRNTSLYFCPNKKIFKNGTAQLSGSVTATNRFGI